MSGAKLMLGDCLEKMRAIPDGSVDAIICDPPYGTTACKWDSVIPLEDMWGQMKRVIKPDGAIVLFGAEPFSSALRMSNIRDYKYDWYWKKNKSTNFLNAKRQPLRNIEQVMVFQTKIYNPQKTTGHRPVNSFTKHSGDGNTVGSTEKGFSGGGQTDRYPTQFLQFDVVNNDNSGGDKFHPTQKPWDLMEYLVKTYTNENETVLDFTMGSGTTGVACKNLNRNFIGIEMDEGYYRIAKKRIEEA